MRCFFFACNEKYRRCAGRFADMEDGELIKRERSRFVLFMDANKISCIVLPSAPTKNVIKVTLLGIYIASLVALAAQRFLKQNILYFFDVLLIIPFRINIYYWNILKSFYRCTF